MGEIDRRQPSIVVLRQQNDRHAIAQVCNDFVGIGLHDCERVQPFAGGFVLPDALRFAVISFSSAVTELPIPSQELLPRARRVGEPCPFCQRMAFWPRTCRRVIVRERANDPPYPFNHKCKLDRNSLQQ